MKTQIRILSVLNYSKDDKKGVRLTYALCAKDSFIENDRFRGLTTVDSFYQSEEVYEKITNDMINVPLEANFISKQDIKNPLKTTSILESIVFNGRTIKLV